MSQTTVANEPVQAYEGKVHDRPERVVSLLASELTYFGKAVSYLGTGELAVGGAGPQSCQLPAAAVDITGPLFAGVAIADPSLEAIAGADYGAYADESMVSVLRRGRIWVVVSTAITDITVGVYARFQNAGGSPPVDSLGSFDSAAGVDVDEIPTASAKWVGAASIGGVDYGLLDLNLP
jgi:hypothetical protein